MTIAFTEVEQGHRSGRPHWKDFRFLKFWERRGLKESDTWRAYGRGGKLMLSGASALVAGLASLGTFGISLAVALGAAFMRKMICSVAHQHDLSQSLQGHRHKLTFEKRLQEDIADDVGVDESEYSKKAKVVNNLAQTCIRDAVVHLRKALMAHTAVKNKLKEKELEKGNFTCEKVVEYTEYCMHMQHELNKARAYLQPAVEFSILFIEMYEQLADRWQYEYEAARKAVVELVRRDDDAHAPCSMTDRLSVFQSDSWFAQKVPASGCVRRIDQSRMRQYKALKGVYYTTLDTDTARAVVERFFLNEAERRQVADYRREILDAVIKARLDEKSKDDKIDRDIANIEEKIRKVFEKKFDLIIGNSDKNSSQVVAAFEKAKEKDADVLLPGGLKVWIPEKDPVEAILRSRFKPLAKKGQTGFRENGRMDPVMAPTEFGWYHGKGEHVRVSLEDYPVASRDNLEGYLKERSKYFDSKLKDNRDLGRRRGNDEDNPRHNRWALLLQDVLRKYDFPDDRTKVGNKIDNFIMRYSAGEKLGDMVDWGLSLGLRPVYGLEYGTDWVINQLVDQASKAGALTTEKAAKVGARKAGTGRRLKKAEAARRGETARLLSGKVDSKSLKDSANVMGKMYTKVAGHYAEALVRLREYEMATQAWRPDGELGDITFESCHQALEKLMKLYEFQHELDKADRYFVYSLDLLDFLNRVETELSKEHDNLRNRLQSTVWLWLMDPAAGHESCGAKAVCYGPAEGQPYLPKRPIVGRLRPKGEKVPNIKKGEEIPKPGEWSEWCGVGWEKEYEEGTIKGELHGTWSGAERRLKLLREWMNGYEDLSEAVQYIYCLRIMQACECFLSDPDVPQRHLMAFEELYQRALKQSGELEGKRGNNIPGIKEWKQWRAWQYASPSKATQEIETLIGGNVSEIGKIRELMGWCREVLRKEPDEWKVICRELYRRAKLKHDETKSGDKMPTWVEWKAWSSMFGKTRPDAFKGKNMIDEKVKAYDAEMPGGGVTAILKEIVKLCEDYVHSSGPLQRRMAAAELLDRAERTLNDN